MALGSTGTHPLSDYREQHIIDTEHYHRVEDGLKYVAWRNNTFSVHVHVGVQGADRAVRVCDRLRPVLPLLLAVSANSPYIDGRDSGLHSGRTQTFTKSFPRCGIPDAFGSWAAWSEYVELLIRTGSIVEFTQLWWSVRPHHSFGTVEVRICDAQTTATEADALAELITACVRRAAAEVDAGETPPDLPHRLIEENMWRAIRYGLDGRLLDLGRRAHRGVRRGRGHRPAQRLGGRDVAPPGPQRRPAPARPHRVRRLTVRGVRRVRAGNPSHVLTGDRAMTQPEFTKRGPAARGRDGAHLRRRCPHPDDRHAAEPRGAQGGPRGPARRSPGAGLEQVRQAIEGARALLPLLEERHGDQLGQVRQTLSQLQMIYAQQAGGARRGRGRGRRRAAGGRAGSGAARAEGPGPRPVVRAAVDPGPVGHLRLNSR